MALPLAPIAGIAMRYGLVALTTYAVVRATPQMRRNQMTEDTFDELHEGVSARRDGSQANAAARFKRTIRLGRTGPGVEVDFAALGRLRITRRGQD